MTSITQKATVSPVPFGKNLVIEGLLLADGNFAIAVPQICSLFSFLIHNASRDIKAILGADFQFLKARTTLNSKAVNYVTLLDFECLIVELTIQGNSTAIALTRSLVGLSLTQVFSDAFNIEFDKADRQAHLTARLAGKITRRSLTDAIKDYVETHSTSENYRQWIYSNCSDKINLALFDKKASQLKKERSCKDNDALRDTHSKAELVLIDRIEGHAVILIDRGMEPQIAVSDAIAFYG